MQAQAHMSGQISGQASNQSGGQLTDMSQHNGSNLPSQSSNVMRMWWHNDPDPDVRRMRSVIQQKIYAMLSRSSMTTPEWQHRLPDMVRRLEEGLFKGASSKEEYSNPGTLDHRLQNLVRRFQSSNRNHNHNLSHHSAPVGTMIPTPGMHQNGNVSTMIPTPGIETSMVSGPSSMNVVPNAMGMGSMPSNNNENSSLVQYNALLATDSNSGKMLPATDNNPTLSGALNNPFQAQQGVGSMPNSIIKGMGLPRGSQMIPTPGMNNSQSISMNSASSSGLVRSNVDSLGHSQHQQLQQQQQQQQFGGGQNNRIYSNMNGQISGIMGMGMQHKNTSYGLLNGGMNNGMHLVGNSQHLMNGSSALSNMGSYPNSSRYGLQPQINQQRQRHLMHPLSHQMTPLSSDGYAMNAADLSGSGNLYGSAGSSGLQTAGSLNPNSIPPQSKMIPVPGLPSQQSNIHSQQQVQQQIQQQNQNQQNSFQSQSPQVSQQYSQQLQQPFQQNVQHHLHHQNQYHHIQHQNQQSQHQQLSNDDTQQFQIASSFSPQKQSSIGMHPQNEGIQHISQASNEQLRSHVTTAQLQQSQSGRPLADQHSPNGQQLNHLSQQSSQKLNQLHSPQEQQQCLSQNDSNSLPTEAVPEAVSQGHHDIDNHLYNREHALQSEDERQGQQEVEQCVTSYEVSQITQPQQQTSVGTGKKPPTTNKADSLACSTGGACASGQTSGIPEARQLQYMKQQRWLLFLRHASRCTAPEGHCQMQNCITARQLWVHIMKCHESQCTYPRCQASKTLLHHHQKCRDVNCPVCGRVRQIILQQRHGCAPRPASGDTGVISGLRRPANATSGGKTETNVASSAEDGNLIQETNSIQQPPLKKPKIEPSSPCPSLPPSETVSFSTGGSGKVDHNPSEHHLSKQSTQSQPIQSSDTSKAAKAELLHVKNVATGCSTQSVLQRSPDTKKEAMVDNALLPSQAEKAESCAVSPNKVLSQVKQESVSIKKESIQVKTEAGQAKQEPSPTLQGADSSASTKYGKPKIKGVSLTELFTPEQIREHITGLRQWVGQSKAKAEKNQAMEHQMSENSCQLCAVEKLTFEPPPIYCTSCGARIKRNAMYYTLGSGDTRHYFCIPCYNEVRGDAIEADGATILKSRLEKRKNDEETEEAWVQCDKCEAWQHQICALFNGRRNEGGQAEYTCPNCYVAEIEHGERKPLPQSAVLGAKDLPRTHLSDHIEQRLFRRLKQERIERARAQEKSVEEVPGAEALVVRVVSSVDKKLEVKQRFLEIFQEEDYPTEFPYKSKVVLLFQKIEGVEVCLFGMYVQEFGAECFQPNQRRVYLSYLDSVKYFRPEIKAVTGEALRTFVYHEILIAYLDYCKRRGLTSCYIWACPPLKGEDYILYCHPEIQKTPKSDKLREWYLTMLRKATRENIVVELTNLYDHFFVSTGECKAKVTAARLPYFDGDYWPGAAEDMIMQLQQAEEDGKKHQKKGKTKKTATKRASKAAAQAELASNASKDALLMQKLGESIFPMKEDFIMVHMQYACAHCCNFIVSGKRWACQQCKNHGKSFNLCERCYEAHQRLDERDRHPVNGREKHIFYPNEVTDVPADTKDKDEIIESEFFDTRQAFLSLCQGNHYQYDTLRRAKHSSMMVLYHLHNPTAPAFVTSCNICHHDIETGQGWRCETCPDFDICNNCYQNNGSAAHPHKLTTHPSLADRDAQSKEARQQRVLQLRIMLDLLVHASQCGNPICQYPNCRRVKGLFRHGMQCKTRASGGCSLCKKMWYILQLHARACKESDCRVPRCKDLKEHLRRLQQQMESRRRAAVMEMMRQRAAEVANNS